MSYSTDADVRPLLPSGGLPNAARVATANATGDYIELGQHGFDDDQAVIFSADAGYSVPTGLTAGTTYYVIVVSQSRFQVAATAGGAAINLTTAGDNFAVWSELPIAAWRAVAARVIDGLVPDHKRPIGLDDDGNYPPVVVQAEAELAAAYGVSRTAGIDGMDRFDAKIESIRARLKDWAKSLPLRGSAQTIASPANLAITASAGAIDPRGWATRGNNVLP